MCPIFDGPQSWNQKILLVCSSRCKNLLNFAWNTIDFHNCHHSSRPVLPNITNYWLIHIMEHVIGYCPFLIDLMWILRVPQFLGASLPNMTSNFEFRVSIALRSHYDLCPYDTFIRAAFISPTSQELVESRNDTRWCPLFIDTRWHTVFKTCFVYYFHPANAPLQVAPVLADEMTAPSGDVILKY